MKQYMKRIMLMFTMAACLFSLSACSTSTDVSGGENSDPQMVEYISQASESLLQSITSLDEYNAGQTEESLIMQGEDGLASGVAAWSSVMKDTGAFETVLSTLTTSEDGKTYVCTIMAQFENRVAEFKAFYTWDNAQQTLVPTSMAIAPEYTTGEKMSKAGMNTLMGMGTVFAVLIFISLIISCFKYISVFENKLKARDQAAAPAPVVSAPAVSEAEPEELVDDLELVAVITAAIAAAANTSTDGLVVRSIKRASGAKWKRA